MTRIATLIFVLVGLVCIGLGGCKSTARAQDFPFFVKDNDSVSCNTTSLWTSPILQQQTNHNDFTDLINDFDSQKIENTSPSSVVIKKVRFIVYSRNAGDFDIHCELRNTNAFSAGIRYGGSSITNTIPNGSGIAWWDFVWIDGTEPVIPANTDFFVGMVVSDPSRGRARFQVQAGGTAYDSTTYRFYTPDSSTTAFNNLDYAFEIYICQ